MVCLGALGVALASGFPRPEWPLALSAVVCILLEATAVKLFPSGFFSTGIVVALSVAQPGWAATIFLAALTCRSLLQPCTLREALAELAPALAALSVPGPWQVRSTVGILLYLALSELCQPQLCGQQNPQAFRRSQARFRGHRWFLLIVAPVVACVQATGSWHLLLAVPLLVGVQRAAARHLGHLRLLLQEALLLKKTREIEQARDELARAQRDIEFREASTKMLIEVTRQLSASHDLPTTAQAAAESLAARIPHRSVAVFAYDQDVLVPVFWTTAGEPPRIPGSVEQQLSVWRSWLQRKAGDLPSAGDIVSGTVRVWPLGTDGALLVDQTTALDDEQLHLAGLIASQTTLGLQSARRFREQQDAQEGMLLASKMAAVGQLAAGVAHELNTPLAAVGLQLELVELQSGISAESEAAIQVAHAAIDEIQGTIGRLLFYSREGSKARAPLDVNEIVHDTLQMLQSQLQVEGIQIATELNESCVASVNANEIQQVLMSLVLHGKGACLQAEAQGKRMLVRSRSSETEVVVDVHDQGAPIQKSIRHRIFDPYFSGQRNKVGLGLSLSAELANQHGGSLQLIDGEPPWTTVFRLRLPRL